MIRKLDQRQSKTPPRAILDQVSPHRPCVPRLVGNEQGKLATLKLSFRIAFWSNVAARHRVDGSRAPPDGVPVDPGCATLSQELDTVLTRPWKAWERLTSRGNGIRVHQGWTGLFLEEQEESSNLLMAIDSKQRSPWRSAETLCDCVMIVAVHHFRFGPP